MSSEQRLQTLRQLLARIEQLPASPERERMLTEVRARVVDVDTGETPRAMLPVDTAPTPTPASAPGPKPARAAKPVARTRTEHHRGSPRPPMSAAEDREWLSLVAKNEILSLDNSAPLASVGETPAGHDRRPWTRGLRG